MTGGLASQPTPSSASRRVGLFRGLLLAGMVFLLALALAEAATRILWSAKGQAFTPQTALLELEQAATLLQDGMLPGDPSNAPGGAEAESAAGDKQPQPFLHPYFGWDVIHPGRDYSEDLLASGEQDPATFDVVVLGGSVAAGFFWAGRDALFDELSKDPRLSGRPLRMIGQAIAGYKQPQQLNRLSYLLALGVTPDLVINLDGFNELALSRVNSSSGIHPLHPSGGHWSRLMAGYGAGERTSGPIFDALVEVRHHQMHATACLMRARELRLERFAMTTDLARWWIGRIRARGQVAYDRFLQAGSAEVPDVPIWGPEYSKRQPNVMELAVAAWANASLAIHGMCQVRGITYLHVLQPTLHDKGSKPLTLEEIESAHCPAQWKQAAEDGYPMLREAGAQLERAGVAFFDASRAFSEIEETLYYDACHFEREGHEVLARAIAGHLLALWPAAGPSAPMPGIQIASPPRRK